jgi:voltage-gated potassium channel
MIRSEDPWKQGWDLAVALMVLLNSIFIPLHLIHGHDPLLVVLVGVLGCLLYSADIMLEFMTVYPSGGEWLSEPRQRFQHYLKNGLVTDVLAALPWVLLGQAGLLPGGYLVLVLLPLLKLLKVNRTVRRIGQNIINPAIFRLGLLVFWILMAAHIIACGWIMVSGNPDSLSPLDHYIKAFYWTMTTLTTIGYGDITPSGRYQMLYVIMIEMFGAAMYGLVIGNIAGLIANIDVAKRQYRDKLDRIGAFLKYRGLPDQLMAKIHSYYSYLWDTRKGYDELAFLEDLPIALRESVALYLNKGIIEKVPIFEHASASLIRDIILKLEPAVFTPGDQIVRAGEPGRDMFFISKGSVSVLSADESMTYATLGSGQFFGEISLLLSMPRTATIKADSFCDLYRLDKLQFDRVVEQYPDFKQSIQTMAEKRREEIEARSARQA